MACIGTSRLCARVERLCQFGHFAQLRRRVTTTACVKSRPTDTRTGGGLLQHCQNKTSTRESRIDLARGTSIMQTQMPGSLPDYQIDPYKLIEDDLKDIFDDIQLELIKNTTQEELQIISTYYMDGQEEICILLFQELIKNTTQEELQTISTYYMDGQGKAVRPMLTILMARAINYHKGRNVLSHSQRQIAMISEMIHSASLLHDDVIDQSDIRRGKPSVNVVWSQKKVAMAGNYILSAACMLLSRVHNDDVTLAISQIVADLVQGEFMQLGSKETENERFAHYLTKSYRKTASLIANCVKAAAILSEVDDRTIEMAFQYGRNVGLAFQLVDDLLDFVASSTAMGKPTAADLKLGLATAPVLFACERYPELNAMIMRRFQESGDVEKAFELVHESNGLEQTRFLAKKHCAEANKIAQSFAKSPYQKALIIMTDLVINRMK